jgi:TolB-like protein
MLARTALFAYADAAQKLKLKQTMSLIRELKRRNVFRVGVAYVVTAWLLIQVTDVVLNNTAAPDWVFSVIMLVLGLGFPVVLIFAWAFEMTPEGIKREKDVDRGQSITRQTGRKLDFAIIAILVMGLAYFIWESRFSGAPNESTRISSNESTVIPAKAGTHGETIEAAADRAPGKAGATEGRPGPDAAAAVPNDKSIAVLPFVNLSSDPEQEYFSDGISEELLNTLARFPGLRVAARTSSFQFKGQNRDIADIADTLKVAHILEGSVRKSGTRLRITAQLIKADDGFHLWSETYDREMTDIFAIQDEIAGAISEALRVQLALDGDQPQAHQPVVIEAANTQAYEAYLRGRQLINRRGREAIEAAVTHLERALRLDNNYAPAHAQLAIATALLLRSPSSYGELTLDEVYRGATPHIQKALSLAPDLAEAHGAQALLALNRAEYLASIGHAERSLELNPSYIDAMNWLYLSTSYLGHYEEQKEVMQRLLADDPLSIVGQLNFASLLASEGKFDEAHQVSDRLLSQYPWAGYTSHGTVAFDSEGELAVGLSWLLYAFSADATDTQSNWYLNRAFIAVGEYREARRVSDDLLYMVEMAEGNIDEAMRATRERVELDPKNAVTVQALADTLHLSGRIAEAQPYYEQLMSDLHGRPIIDVFSSSHEPTVRMALGRRQAGDMAGAEAVIRLVQRDFEAQRRAGFSSQYMFRAEAMIAALEGDPESAISLIRDALDRGLRERLFFIEPAFENLREDAEFLALKDELERRLLQEHERVLQLICFENPVPDAWQPLPETCEGVERRQ